MSKKKILLIPFVIASAVVVAVNATSCKSGYSVTFHPGDGHTINGKSEYSYNVDNEIELEPTPDTKSGCSFVGWYKDKELKGDMVVFPLKVTANVDLYASYNNISGTHVVTFNTDGGSDVPIYNINDGDEIKSAPITTKEDYNFKYWSDKDGNEVSFPLKPSSDLVLTAKWEKIAKGYVKFHTNGGSPLENFEKVETEVDTYKTKSSVSSITVSPATTKSNYNFLGWFDNSEFKGEAVKFPYTVSKDGELFAKWESVPASGGFTLHLVDEEKTSDINNVTYIAYEPSITRSKEGYTFNGWTDGSEGAKIIEFPITIDKETFIYAKWEKNKQCAITFKDCDGTDIKVKEYDKNLKINSPFEYTGKNKEYGQFKGWKVGSETITFPYIIPNDDTLTITADVDIDSAKIVVYDSEDTKIIRKDFGNIKSLASQPDIFVADRLADYKLDYLCTDNTKQSETKISKYPFTVSDADVKKLINNHEIKLYAVWKQDERYYNITLEYGDDITPSSTIIEHQQGKIKPSSFTKASAVDKVITGWKDENGILLDNEKEIILSKDRTFTAVWEYTHRKLIVNRNNGTVDTYDHMLKKDLTYGDVPRTSKKHYKFLGYTLKGESSQKTHGLTDSLILKDDNTTEITEVYEETISSCTLTIVYSDAEKGITLNNRVIDEQPLEFNTNTLPIETYVDYKITGFIYDGTTYKLGDTITLATTSSEVTISAVWEKTAFTVAFDYNDGSSKKQILEHASLLTSKNIPTLTRTNYRFIGYSETTDGEVISLLNKPVTKDVIYYAKWVSATEPFTVKFHLGSLQALAKFDTPEAGTSGRITTRSNQTSPIEYDSCPKVSCEGCAFLGWYISENSTTTPTFPLTTDQTLYARWAPLSNYITISLNVTSGGVFKDIGETTLLTSTTTTKWSELIAKEEVKSLFKSIDFGDAFVVSGWKDSDGKIVNGDTTFSGNTYLYSVNAEDIQTPSNFATDNWPTICSVFEKGFTFASTKTHSEGGYKEEYISTSGKSTNSFVGLTRTLKYRNKDYTVRVVGQQQDYNTSGTQGLPLTFEFTEVIGIETQDVYTKFSDSLIKPKLLQNGTIYNGLQYSLICNKHITQVRKYTPYSSGTETIDTCLFLPSCIELGLGSSYMSYNNSFAYTYYSGKGDDYRIKKYRYGILESEITPYSYWTRDCRNDASSEGTHGAYFVDKDGKSSIYASIVGVGRGIAPMFCIGKIV